MLTLSSYLLLSSSQLHARRLGGSQISRRIWYCDTCDHFIDTYRIELTVYHLCIEYLVNQQLYLLICEFVSLGAPARPKCISKEYVLDVHGDANQNIISRSLREYSTPMNVAAFAGKACPFRGLISRSRASR